MADESANTVSLVRRTSRPRVAQAAWLSRIAARRRPKDPRLSARTPMPTSANTIPHSTAKAVSPTKLMPKIFSRPMSTPPWP